MARSGGWTKPPRGAAYNPTPNSWRPIAEPPGGSVTRYPQAVWTGSEAVVELGAGAVDQPILAAYDPVADAWLQLDAPAIGQGRRPKLLWTGTEVLLSGQPAHQLLGTRRAGNGENRPNPNKPTRSVWIRSGQAMQRSSGRAAPQRVGVALCGSIPMITCITSSMISTWRRPWRALLLWIVFALDHLSRATPRRGPDRVFFVLKPDP